MFKRSYLEGYTVIQLRTKYDDEVIARIMGPAAVRQPLQERNSWPADDTVHQLSTVQHPNADQRPIEADQLLEADQRLVDQLLSEPEQHSLPSIDDRHTTNTEVSSAQRLARVGREVDSAEEARAEGSCVNEDRWEQLLFSELFWLPAPLSALPSSDAEEGSSSAAEDLSLAADQSLISDLEYDESFVDAVLKDANIFHDPVVDVLDLTTRGVNGEIGDGCEGSLIRTAEVADTMVTNRQDPGVGQSQPRTVSPVAARGSAAVLPSDLTLRRKRKRSSSASRMQRRKMAAGSESDQSSDIRTSVPQEQECHHNMPVLF